MAFAGASLIAEGKLCALTALPIDARADAGYHLLVVEGYSRSKGTPPNRECIKSRPFLVGGHRWIVDYYPNGYKDDDEEFISVYLGLDDEVGGQEGVSQGVEAQYAFSFIDQPELRASTIIRQSKKFDFSTEFQGYSRFMKKEVLERSRHLKDDSFIIRCDVVVVKADNNTEEHGAGTTAPVLIHVPPSDMQSHFGNLLRSKEGADIIFELGGEEFAAHRCVLAARSAIFKAQLFGAMDVGATTPSVVKIDGIKADVFRHLLTFIYTDALILPWDEIDGNMEEDEAYEEKEDSTEDDGAENDGNMEEDEAYEEKEDSTEDDGAENEGDEDLSIYMVSLLQLLEAADRYDLQKLKSICEEVLASCYIWADSVADIVVVADRRGCRWLKEACLEFIKSHTSVYTFFTPDCLDQIIRTTSPCRLKELFSKFPVS